MCECVHEVILVTSNEAVLRKKKERLQIAVLAKKDSHDLEGVQHMINFDNRLLISICVIHGIERSKSVNLNFLVKKGSLGTSRS